MFWAIMRKFAFALAFAIAGGPALADQVWDDCRQQVDHDRAIAGCTTVLNRGTRASSSNRMLAFYHRGVAYYFKNAYDRAIVDFDAAIRINPNEVLFFLARGLAYGAKSSHDQAIANYDAAIRINPNDPRGFTGRGFVYAARGAYDRAIADYDAALRIDPNIAMALYNRGNAYDAKGAHDRAIADYDAAIRIEPNFALAFNDRGSAYRAKGAYDRAIADFDAALRIDPSLTSVFSNRGFAYAGQGVYDRAIADFDAAIRINPNDVRSFVGRGLAYHAQAAHDRAIADFDAALRINPSLAMAFDLRGLAYHDKGAYDRAIADYDTAIRIEPNNAGAFNNRGNAYRAKGAYDRAIADLDEAIRINPTFAEAFDSRGDVYRDKGDYDRAIVEYDMAIRLNPNLTVAINNRTATLALKAERDKVQAAQGATPVIQSLQPVREARLALVIGNGAYSSTRPLPNPSRDADAVAAVLRQTGFTVTTHKDLGRRAFIEALDAFSDAAAQADWALIYFAGHGMEINGVNYLIPTDAALKADRNIPDEAVSLDRVLTAISTARRLRLVVLDACRDNPFVQNMRITVATRSADELNRGLARVEPMSGTLVVYAAKHGSKARDGRDGENSPFVASFVRRIVEPGMEINMAFRMIGGDVLAATGRAQEPFVYGSLPPEPFFFVPARP